MVIFWSELFAALFAFDNRMQFMKRTSCLMWINMLLDKSPLCLQAKKRKSHWQPLKWLSSIFFRE